MGYRIGSFNVRKLSFSTKDTSLDDGKSVTRDYNGISEIIRDNFDIVALQEVMNDNVLKRIFPKNTKWEYRWKLSRSKEKDSTEGYAFAWNAKKFRPVAEPNLWVQYQGDPVLGRMGLLRHPFYGRFTPSGTTVGGPSFEIRLINTHIRFNPTDNNTRQASSIDLRRREFIVLTEQILNRLEDKRYGNNMAAYTILLGDYNLNLSMSPYLQDDRQSFMLIKDAGHTKKLITVQDKPTTLAYHKSSPNSNEYVFQGFSNNYDHFTYDETFFDNRGIKLTADALDTVALYKNSDFERHWREISDHIPILLELNLK